MIVNFCINCAHYHKGWFLQSAHCAHAGNEDFDLVTGEKRIKYEIRYYRERLCLGEMFRPRVRFKQATAVRT